MIWIKDPDDLIVLPLVVNLDSVERIGLSLIVLFSRKDLDIPMLVQIQYNRNAPVPSIIVPLVKDSNQASVMEALSTAYGLDSGKLITDFKCDPGDIQILYPENDDIERIILLGLGDKISYSVVRNAFRRVGVKFKDHLIDQIGIDFLIEQNQLDLNSGLVGAAVNGFWLGYHQLGTLKSEQKNVTPPSSLSLYAQESIQNDWKSEIELAVALGETQTRIMDLVNAPANKLTPGDLASWARESGNEHGYEVNIRGREQIKELGLKALEAVSQGSDVEPAFISCEYKGDKSTSKITLGLVGKGITFDTGGISIKPSSNMEYMKSDMGGGAAVLGIIELAARLKLKINIVAIVPSAQNDVGSKAVKPGDVVGSYLGKSIEVINTDAEGRMILADGLSYLNQTYDPDILVDLATLTGSCVRAIGFEAAGLFSNNTELSSELIEAGELVGERLWAFPMWDEYKGDLESDVADLRNIGVKPVADAINAAKFLEVFIDGHANWAHLDIAGVAFGDSKFSAQKSASAFGVGLLLQFLLKLISRGS